MNGQIEKRPDTGILYLEDDRALLPELRKERPVAVEEPRLPALVPLRLPKMSLSPDELADRAVAALISLALVGGIYASAQEGGFRAAGNRVYALGQRMDRAVTMTVAQFGRATSEVGDAYLSAVYKSGTGFAEGAGALGYAAGSTAQAVAVAYLDGLSRMGDMFASIPSAAGNLGSKTSLAAVATASGAQGAIGAVLKPAAVAVYKAIHPLVARLANMGKR